MSKKRVLLVDDQQIVRLGLMTLIDDQPDMQVIGEAGTAAEAIRQAENLRPDVVLMDVRMPGEGAIDASGEISRKLPGTSVIILTSYPDDELLVRAIRAGAAGYVLKQVGNEELLHAIRATSRHEAVLDPASTARIFERVRQAERKADEDAFRGLSERELDVLDQIRYGKSNAEIGKILNLSESTVRNYVSTILEKLGLSNRIELAAYAVEHNISDFIRK